MASKANRSSSPVHLHVDRDTAVHLYVDKENNFGNEISSYDSPPTRVSKGSRRPRKPGYNIPTSKLMKNPSTKSRVRSASPPWIPPPGKTTKNNKSGLGPFWSENEANLSQQEIYERQINDLLEEVGQLREQLDDEKQKDSSYELKQEQDMQSKDDYEEEVEMDEEEKKVDSEKLITSLIDTELSVQRCSQQINHMMDNMKKILKENHKVNQRDVDRISTMKEDTELRIEEFNGKSNNLRDLLNQWQCQIKKEEPMKNNSNFQAMSMEKEMNNLKREIEDRDELIEKINRRLCEKEKESLGFNTTQESLEQIRAHLQQQLKQRSGDCNRMAVQIRTLENELAKERLDKEHLLEMLRNPRGDKDFADRETLKRAGKAHKQRATKAEEAVQELSTLLADKERQIEQLMLDSHDDQLKIRQLESCAEENEYLRDKLDNNPSDKIIISLKRENENLRAISNECEAKLRQVEKDMKVLRENIADESEDAQNSEQMNKLSNLIEKLEASEKSNKANITQINELEKQVKNLEGQNGELKKELQAKDGNSVDVRCKLDELTKENASLMRQLETALTDSKRNDREKSIPRSSSATNQERTFQSRLHDLETQLAQQRAEANKWRRNCEDAERKCETRLQDVKLQLEQAERTNHSLQTYVQFLKKSYANVFGDVPLLTNGTSFGSRY